MKNKFVLLLVLLFTFNAVFAQKNTVHLVSSNDKETVLTFKLNSFDFKNVKTPNGKEIIVISEDLTQILQKGYPDLPKFTESIIIPDLGKTKLEVISSEFYEIEDINIAPSKGNFFRDIDPSTVPYEYGEVYSKDAFFPNQIANADKPYIVRDFRGQAVHVYPLTYNPVKKIIRVYTEITVKVVSGKEKGKNEFNRIKAFNKIDREFKEIYSNHFINYENQTKYTPVEEEGNMLIICYDDWTDQVQPLVDWKNTIGRLCEMVTVTDAGGTASAIKTYVENYYNTNGLTYLLLVGDAAQIPTNSGGFIPYGDSDNAYAYITGDDHYLEFFVGRFSAETPAHVETQVLRTIEYEKGDQLASGWLNKSMSVGSDQGPGDDNEMDYEHLRNMQTDLFGFTYVEPPYEHFDGSQGGNDAAGNPSPSDVAGSLNSGLGIANYTGHGSTTDWSSSNFSVSDINNLTNDNKLPFIWSVACLNGNFDGNTCFGEAWLRAEHNGEPTGGIAIMASTMNQSWSPPMSAQDEMVDLLVESYINNIKRTFAGISINGCFLMNDEYPGSEGSSSNNSGYTMTDTWTCFGDPSLYVRTDDPSDMTITHNDFIIVGESNFDVNCDLNGAIATLSRDGLIVGSAVVSSGSASIPVSGVTPGETLTLAVVGFNKVTYLTELDVVSPSGPYMVIESYINEVGYGQTVNLDMTVENIGQDDATGVSVTVTTSDPNANITNGTYAYGDIASGATSSASSGAFTLTVADNLEDQYSVAVDIAITDGNKTLWEQTKNVTVNAPEFSIGEMTLTNDDNSNGRLDPGESATLTFTTNNNGHADASYVLASLSGDSPYFTVMNNDQTVSITSESFTDVSFNVQATQNAPEGSLVNLTYNVTQGVYTANSPESLTIGQAPEIIVGTGTSESDGYPFYTWYKNNKSQILFLGSELGAGEINIQEIAFDFIQNDPEILSLTNLTIKFKETSITAIGSSYADITGATTVLSSTSYTMPTEAGWYSFETDDYIFNATDNNLLIEISWGANSEYGPYNEEYKLNCTNTTFTSVAYGYDDYNTPPDYGDNSSLRPNTTFYFEGEASGDVYTINFTVQDENSDPITDADVTVGALEQAVDGSGQTSFSLVADDYYYSVTAPGFEPIVNTPFVVTENADITVIMSVSGIEDIEQIISIFPNPNNGTFNIDLRSLSEITDVKIYNINGQVIYQSKTSNDILEVNLTNYAKGVYFVRITSGNEAYNSKIILK